MLNKKLKCKILTLKFRRQPTKTTLEWPNVLLRHKPYFSSKFHILPPFLMVTTLTLLGTCISRVSSPGVAFSSWLVACGADVGSCFTCNGSDKLLFLLSSPLEFPSSLLRFRDNASSLSLKLLDWLFVWMLAADWSILSRLRWPSLTSFAEISLNNLMFLSWVSVDNE